MAEIDWTGKRIKILNYVLSGLGIGLIGVAKVWELVSNGRMEWDQGTGMIFIIWFMSQLFYGYKMDHQRLLDRLKNSGHLD